MAATGTTTPAAATVPGSGARARLRAALGDVPPGPAALGAALAVALLYGAFASGAIGIPEESRLQVGVAAIAFVTVAGLLFSRDLRFDPAPGGLAGLALLGAFAAWAALSITWSVAPDETWLELNRAVAYGVRARRADRGAGRRGPRRS